MSVEKGYSRYRCDRCEKEAYLKEGSPSLSAWKTITRYTSDGTKQDYVLCPTCHAAYKKHADKADESFLNFMISTEEV